MFRILLFSIIFLSVDQLTKWFVVFYLELQQKLYLNLNNPFMNFYMAWNKGINFGLFQGDSVTQAYLLTAVSVVISIIFFIWLRNSKSFMIHILAALVVGGALGNAIDRLLYGAVADFINVTCCGFRNPYSFNLADVFIFIGLIGLLVFKFDEKQN
ncbi:MAG: signal peptidase II [Paracoccaceae bacterium]|tara:strand:- start:95 stop:562 length:468 start_codon:yes stop_codon:yes gene_type:complete